MLWPVIARISRIEQPASARRVISRRSRNCLSASSGSVVIASTISTRLPNRRNSFAHSASNTAMVPAEGLEPRLPDYKSFAGLAAPRASVPTALRKSLRDQPMTTLALIATADFNTGRFGSRNASEGCRNLKTKHPRLSMSRVSKTRQAFAKKFVTSEVPGAARLCSTEC